MHTISLRAFRDRITTLHEPVIVMVRRDGWQITLGTWTPSTAEPIPAGAAQMTPGERHSEHVSQLERFTTRPFTPAPKPGKR